MKKQYVDRQSNNPECVVPWMGFGWEQNETAKYTNF